MQKPSITAGPAPHRRAAARLRQAALAAGLTLAACTSPPSDPEALAALKRDEAWAALLAAHDRDGDGRILAAEHDRGGRAFEHLDRDGDGLLTRADLDVPITMPPELTAPMLLVRAFGTPGTDGVDAEAIAEGFALADADASGGLTREEFLALPNLQGSTPDIDRFGTLLAALRDGEAGAESEPGALTEVLELDALRRYVARRDTDGDGRLVRRERLQAGPAPACGHFPRGQREEAPDFTAALLAAGGALTGGDHTLSSLRGRPVALVFGSFT